MRRTPQKSKYWKQTGIGLFFALGLNLLAVITDSVVWTYISLIPVLYVFVIFVVTFSNTDPHASSAQQNKKSADAAKGTMVTTHRIQAFKTVTGILLILSTVCAIASGDYRWTIMVIIAFLLFFAAWTLARSKR